ncbi:DUF2894 domain-containing protein [Stenotrophomonas sp. MMGLT7]|uniref:DUF2894 domain-containing protein n=1 Tax=Stenotrophomonas sp. MMGLT7 TaxID=2901227 RepID=UPI002F90B7FA|nr:DUF2894 domain-containing protein [Stenotrophomonas sp. MMGLT7]
MSDSAARRRARPDARHGQNADRPDPMRQRIAEALASRADRHDGEVRRILDRRLSGLRDGAAADRENAASTECKAGTATPPREPARGPLGELLEYIASHAAAKDPALAAGDPAAPPAFPELPALDEFRQLWSTLRTESQLRQSLQQAPANAGPLNSATLVHRAIALMRERSPGYLQHFLSYVDALAWMEQLGSGMTAREAPRNASGRKRPRSRSRKPPGD